MAFKYKLKGECLVIPTNLYDKKKNIVAIKCWIVVSWFQGSSVVGTVY